jgi:replicative DNA helicase
VIERLGTRDTIPPQNLEAEQSVLGAMMIDRVAVERAREILQPDDFYRDAHQRIFEAMWDLAERSEPVDLVTLSDALRVRQHLDQIGGVSYLATLADIAPTTANIEYYARIVEHKAILRRLIEASNRITGWAYEQPDEVDTIVDRAEQEIFKVGRRQMGSSFYPLKTLVSQGWDAIESAYEDQSEVTGVDTGFTRFNFMTSGLQPSDLVIVAARPSMGKTAFSLGMAVNAAKSQPMAVAVFSLEMSKEQLTIRMITSEARVNAHRLRTGYLREGDWARIGDAVARLSDLKVFIDDSSDVTPTQMRAKCRRLAVEENLGLIVIDYLQLIRGGGKDENRNQEITTIARQLKSMAKELHVPVVALSQLSRAVEKREDKRPMLSDLRESGSIEAEADVVCFLYRESYYKRKEESSGGLAQMGHQTDEHRIPGEEKSEVTEIIIAKHRNGPVGTVKLTFLPEYAKFEDLAEYEEEPAYQGS